MIRRFIILLFSCLLSFIVSAQPATQVASKPYLQPGAPLKSMKLLTLERRTIFTDSLPKDKKVMFITLNLTCEHCLLQTTDLMQNLAKFDDTYILITTGEVMRDYVMDYSLSTGYNEKPNLVLTFDEDHSTDDVFAFKGLPQIMVYGTNKRLYKVFYNEQKIETLVQALAEAETATYEAVATKPAKPNRKFFRRKK